MSIKRDTVEARKALPLASGVLDYFPDALLAVAEVSRVGNEQHHPGAPLHWDKSKSTDEADALLRHLLDRGTLDTDGLRHSGKVAWRALALLQRELDAEAAQESSATILDMDNLRPAQEIEASLADFLSRLDLVPCAILHSEEWGDGDGPITEVTYRGEWPPDTRVNGLLTCCGQSEHPVDCPQWR